MPKNSRFTISPFRFHPERWMLGKIKWIRFRTLSQQIIELRMYTFTKSVAEGQICHVLQYSYWKSVPWPSCSMSWTWGSGGWNGFRTSCSYRRHCQTGECKNNEWEYKAAWLVPMTKTWLLNYCACTLGLLLTTGLGLLLRLNHNEVFAFINQNIRQESHQAIMIWGIFAEHCVAQFCSFPIGLIFHTPFK